MVPRSTKFIVVTGGVLSGLGKGITTAAIGHLLKSHLKVVPIKCDGYLNTDPGTMNPIEHGEVFVQDDGGEVDMDFGHYERFMGINTRFRWNLTMGKVYKKILEKERKGEFLGKTVQLIPHVTDVIKEHFYTIAKEENADIIMIEIGGTVGDMEHELNIESVRQLKQEVGRDNVVFIHLTYIPIPTGVKEQKTKPTQQSVKILNERGIWPDIIMARSAEYLTEKNRKKIALFCNVEPEAVITGLDVDTVYRIPLIYDAEGVTAILHRKLGIYSPPKLDGLRKLVDNLDKSKCPLTIKLAIAGKYTDLHDSYASIIEAITHTTAHVDAGVEIAWIDTTEVEEGKQSIDDLMQGIDAVIVPGGFGTRGIEGKIEVVRYCREHNVPFLGICYGMQLAVIEFARNVCEMQEAHTTEVEDDGGKAVDSPVVCILPDQIGVTQKGATMRLGGHDVHVMKGSRAHAIYGKEIIRERFRHRYEVNPDYVPELKRRGMVFSGYTPDKDIMQIMELPNHPYFVGSQFHPELTSRLETPSPLFLHLVKTAIELKRAKTLGPKEVESSVS